MTHDTTALARSHAAQIGRLVKAFEHQQSPFDDHDIASISKALLFVLLTLCELEA